jgi:hypothetical protein
MRRFVGALIALAVAAGCRNQSTGAFTNPFLTPDRVPPPPTRVLAPGTALPYYPGDPAPSAAPPMGVPATTTYPPNTAYPPATTTTPTNAYPAVAPTGAYPTTGGYPPNSGFPAGPPLTTPPGGWPPQSLTSPAGLEAGGETVSVPADNQRLRFASAPSTLDGSSHSAPSAPSIDAIAAAPAGTTGLPIQSILPLGGGQQIINRLSIREVTPAEYLAPASDGAPVDAVLASAASIPDGFRPQGSRPRSDSAADRSFRPPEIRRTAVQEAVISDRYAAGSNHEWLRGQLEYWPMTGQWSLRYLPEGAPADALGGRVMIDNPQVLANLEPGELVMVRGQLHGRASETGGLTPAYRVSAVQRQRR